jgi:hypothetical protein
MVPGSPLVNLVVLGLLAFPVPMEAAAQARQPACAGSEYRSESQLLRIRVDDARRNVWILATDALYRYERVSGQTTRYLLPGWIHMSRSFACLPDLVVEPAGTVIASSNVVPSLWRVDPETSRVERLEIQLGAESHRDMGFTGLDLLNAGVILARSSIDQSVWRIDLPAKRAWRFERGNARR